MKTKAITTIMITLFLASMLSIAIPLVSASPTIQDLIDAASPDDTINLAAVTYYEGEIHVDKPLTIQGAGMTSTVIDATAKNHGIYIEADDVTIKDLTVQGAIHRNIVWYTVTVSGSTIEDVEIQGAGSAGMEVHHSTVTNVLVKDCDFEGNTITNYGIRIDSAGVVNDFTVEDSTFDNHVIAGIGSYGYIDGLTVSGSTFTNAWCGIMLGAEAYGPEYIPKYIRNVDVSFCDFHDNDIGFNVYVYGSLEHEIENINVHYCSITSNNDWGVIFYDFNLDYEDVVIDARFNWWGDPTGPTRQLPNGKWVGKGDKVSDNVKFAPWLPHPWLPIPRP